MNEKVDCKRLHFVIQKFYRTRGFVYKFQNIGCLVQLHHGDLHVVSISTEFLLMCDLAIL